MQEALELPKVNLDVAKWIEISKLAATGKISTAQDVADYLGITEAEGLAVIMDNRFSTLTHNLILGQYKLKYDAAVLPKLFTVAEASEDGRELATVSKEIREALGLVNKDKASGPNIHIHLEQMLNDLQKSNKIIDITPTKFPGLDE